LNKVSDKSLNIGRLLSHPTVSGGAVQVAASICGYLAARATVYPGIHPFGLALASGINSSYFISATIGAVFGSFGASTGAIFRYTAALFAIVSVRYLLSNYESRLGKPIWSAILCIGVTVLTGSVTATVSFTDSLPVFAEGILAGCAAYFISSSKDIFPLRLHAPSESETAGAIVLTNILLMGLYPIEFSDISLGRLSGVGLILAAARYGKTAGGAIAGVTASIALLLSGGGIMNCLALAVGGVFAGLFHSLPKIAGAFVLLLSTTVLMITTGNTEQTVLTLFETGLGCILYLLLPKRICVILSGIFSPEAATPTLEGMQISLRNRLRNASEAIYDVTQTVDEVAERLRRINSPSFEQAVALVEKDACVGCCLRLECWETRKSNTVSSLVNACSQIKRGGDNTVLNDKYEMGCLRPDKVWDSLSKRYSAYLSRTDAEKRLQNIQGVVSDQFCGISDMLYELSCEFDDATCFDIPAAAKVSAALGDLGITVSECGCIKDKAGRMRFEMRIPLVSENINRGDIVACLEEICGRPFSAPKVIRGEDYLSVSVSEKPRLSAEVGLYQHPDDSPTHISGDSANYFFDERSRLCMVLSDGMGTGGRAAVDGALLSGLLTRLISAGFSADCALKISNSAMLFRSSDESMATADITSIDLNNGTVEMYKAGAAPTLVRKKGRTGKAESHSLPAGILREIAFDHASIPLDDGDIILMMSDGAVADGTDWICAELEDWGDGSAAALANRIAEGAARRCREKHTDDITVMAAILRSA